MAYSVPDQWSRGDIPTAAKMNKYSDSLNAINSLATYTGGSVAVYAYNTDPEEIARDFQHVHRWLHYEGSGDIVDTTGVGDSVSLSTEGSTVGVYDLDSVSWLYYGAYYRIEGIDWAAEDWEP